MSVFRNAALRTATRPHIAAPAEAATSAPSGAICETCLANQVNYAAIADEHGHGFALTYEKVDPQAWGADSLIEAFPFAPGVGVDVSFERDQLFEHLDQIAHHGRPGMWCLGDAVERETMLAAMEPNEDALAFGGMARAARILLTAWSLDDRPAEAFRADQGLALRHRRDVETILWAANDYLSSGHVPAALDEEIRRDLDNSLWQVMKFGYALALTRCTHRTYTPHRIGGVPATITAACAEVLADAYPELRDLDRGAFLFWLAHVALWCTLNGGSERWLTLVHTPTAR